MNYFEVQAKHLKQQENGLIKAVATHLLIWAVNFSEAETIAFRELTGEKEIDIRSIKRSKIADVVGDEPPFHKVRIAFLAGENGDKLQKQYLLVSSETVENANLATETFVSDWLTDVTIDSVAFSPIVQVVKGGKSE